MHQGETKKLVLVIVLVLLAGCAPAAGPQRGTETDAPPRGPMILRDALTDDPPSFGSRFGGFNGRYNALINAFWARTDYQGSYTPYLMEKLPSQEDGTWTVNPDGTMKTVWTVRADARWQDGQPVTAHDLVFSDMVYRDPAITAEPSG